MNLNPLLILASGSPRRRQLLKEAGFDFIVQTKDVPEDFEPHLAAADVPLMLARRKADAFELSEVANEVVIAADTVVIIDGMILNKPENAEAAYAMLAALSGRDHDVVTGVCIRNRHQTITFSDLTKVFFRKLDHDEITHYIEKYEPYDKAGAYGAQEWMGMVAIERIEGSYFNVMGLPVHKVYTALNSFLEQA